MRARPSASTISAALRPETYMLLEDLLRGRSADSARVDERDQAGQRLAARSGTCSMAPRRSRSACASAPPSPSCWPPSRCRRGRDRLEVVGAAPVDCVSTPASYSGSPYCATNRAPPRLGKLRQGPAHRSIQRGVDDQRRQVRLGEVAVVVGLLLGPHRRSCARWPDRRAASPARSRPPASRTLDLALDLELDRALHVAERVEVLELGLDAERASAPRGRTETLASQRRLPSSMLPSLTPMATRTLADAAEGFRGVGRRAQVGLGRRSR